MEIYNIIRWYRRIRSPRIKLMGILALHLLKRRYVNMFFDPSLSCNLRCRMCYFSDPEARKNMHGSFTEEDIQAIAHSLFHRVLRLQIGCGAEPTTFKYLDKVIKLASEHGVPHISMTTNGQLLTLERLKQLVENGLDELILSAHGLSEKVYEDMMPNAKFAQFLQTLENLKKVKAEHPPLKIRLNYTINADNIQDLVLLPEVFADIKPNVIQLRPIQKIGESEYNNFSMEQILQLYDEYVSPAVQFCAENNITCIYPQRENLMSIGHENDAANHVNSVIEMLPCFQLSPFNGWKDKIDPYHETFEDYCRRTNRVKFILHHLFGRVTPEDKEKEGTTKALNYQIKR